MQLQYIINRVGIYVEESDNAAWNASVASRLQRELDISLGKVGEKEVKQKLLIKPYSLLSDDSIRQGFVTPEHSVYDNGLLTEFSLRVAFKVEKDCLTLWVDKDHWPDFQYILQMLFAQRNMVFVHAAGIAINNKGVVLPTFCGTGKTSFVSEAAKIEGVRVLGDDFVLLDDNGNLYPFPRPFGLRAYHKTFFPEYFRENKVKYTVELNLWERVMRRLKHIVQNLPGTFFPEYFPRNKVTYRAGTSLWQRSLERLQNLLHIPTDIYESKMVSPSLLFDKGKIADKEVPLERVYIVRWYRGIKDIRCTETQDMEGMVNFCTAVLFHETYESLRMNFNLLAIKEESPSAYYKFFEDVIRAGLSRSSHNYLVDVPEGMPATKFAKEMIDLIIANE